MKPFITKMVIALFGLTLASAPLAASAAQWGVGVGLHSGGGVAVRAGYSNGWHGGGYYHGGYYRGGGYYHGGYGWRPAPVYHAWYPAPGPRFVEGYYGWAPGGFYGYYSQGHWFAHRRWNGGIWIYF